MVCNTLIRCHFSPKESTGSRFLYTASADGNLYIYDIFKNILAAKLDNKKQKVTRDCIWHPYENTIISADWGGNLCSWTFNNEDTNAK